MAAWAITQMGGVIPRMDERLIPDNMAAESVNCDLTSGELRGLSNSEFLVDLTGTLPVVERAYRLPPLETPEGGLPSTGLPPVNTRAPIVTGVGIVGQPLISGTGQWDNLPNRWTVQWFRDGVLIPGTDINNFVYYVQSADVGYTITSVVTAYNIFGSTVSPVSNGIVVPSSSVSNAAPVNVGAPFISGSASPGYVLHCSNGAWINAPDSFIIQWFLDGQTVLFQGTDYMVQPSDLGHNIFCVVIAINIFGSTVSLPSNTVSISTSDVVIQPQPPGDVPVNIFAPFISGNPAPYYQLSVSMGIWNNTPESFFIQWRSDGVNVGGNFPFYNVDPADVGHVITCIITAINFFGSNVSLPSNQVLIPVPITIPVLTSQPFVSGIPLPNYQLSCDMGVWLYSPSSYVGAWYRDGTTLVSANSTTYDVVADDVGHDITCVVTATNNFGSVTAGPSNAVRIGVPATTAPPINTVAPWISGNGIPGYTLHCDLGTWINVPETYLIQWIRDDNVVLFSGYVDYINGSDYVVSYYDIGHTITCIIYAQNHFGVTTALPSNMVSISGFRRSPLEAPFTSGSKSTKTSSPSSFASITPTSVNPSDGSAWLPLPSRFSSVVRSPLANDQHKRIYWTNPGDLSPHWTTQDRIRSGVYSHFDLGIVQPVYPPVLVTTTGGTPPPGADAIDRAYVYTYANDIGEESSPSPPSNVLSGPPDAVWTINLPTTAPAAPEGIAYPPPIKMKIYRTITGADTGSQFYFVEEFILPAPATYNDEHSDNVVVLNQVLESAGWDNPPLHLDGLVAMPGGFLCGFVGNTIHFSEPDRPHAWPGIYAISAHYAIVTLAVWQQYLMVMTSGYPSAGSGNMPSNFVLVQTQVAEPCIARGSVVVDLSGVYYASQNGLIQFTGYGMQNVTAQLVEKDEWLMHYQAKKLLACRHRSQFLGINETHSGFLIDYAEPRLAFQDLSYLRGVVCVWNDEYTGSTLLCVNGQIYEWDKPGKSPQIYRWVSKNFSTPLPISLGAIQVDLGREILSAPPPVEDHPLSNGDPTISLPPGINAVFKYYAGPQLQLIMTRNLTKQQEIFRLPKGFKAFDHQVEVTSRVPISSIQISTTLEELKGV